MYGPVLCSTCSIYVFLFQAEDGIRYLVRSRGLGDVYKRQVDLRVAMQRDVERRAERPGTLLGIVDTDDDLVGPVSYTHLTLPTSDLV